jgi:hypothetical protein
MQREFHDDIIQAMREKVQIPPTHDLQHYANCTMQTGKNGEITKIPGECQDSESGKAR